MSFNNSFGDFFEVTAHVQIKVMNAKGAIWHSLRSHTLLWEHLINNSLSGYQLLLYVKGRCDWCKWGNFILKE